MKASIPTPTIPTIPEESEAEYALRAAASFIRAYAADKPVIIDDYDEPITGEILSEICMSNAQDLADQRIKNCRSMIFTGQIIQAGNEGGDETQPTVTIRTGIESLKRCKAIPFYQPSEITITPIH